MHRHRRKYSTLVSTFIVTILIASAIGIGYTERKSRVKVEAELQAEKAEFLRYRTEAASDYAKLRKASDMCRADQALVWKELTATREDLATTRTEVAFEKKHKASILAAHQQLWEFLGSHF